MTSLLGVLLLFDIGVAGYLGLRLFGEIRQAQWLQAQMDRHRARAASLESELEGLRPYAVIADAERHAAGIIASAHSQAHELSRQYEKYVSEVLAWAEAAFEAATAQAKEIVRGAKQAPVPKTQPIRQKSRFFEETAFPIHRVVEGPLDPPAEEVPVPRLVRRPARQARQRDASWLQNEIPFDFMAEPRVAHG